MGLGEWMGRVVAAPFTGGASLVASGDTVKSAADSLRGAVVGKPAKSSPVEIPGLYDREEGAGYARRGVGMTGLPSRYSSLLDARFRQPVQNPYGRALQSELLGPARFAPISDAERALVDQAYSGRQAAFNNLGIGASPSAQSGIAAAAAPTLANLRQSHIQNLMGGSQLFSSDERGRIEDLLAAMGRETGNRQLDTQALMQAAQFAVPQVANTSTGPKKGLLDYAVPVVSSFLAGGG